VQLLLLATGFTTHSDILLTCYWTSSLCDTDHTEHFANIEDCRLY